MKGIRQTTFRPSPGPGAGNCVQAAIASLFELELDQVPHFAEQPDDDHFGYAAEDWFRERGWGFVEIDVSENRELVAWFSGGSLCLVYGTTSRESKHVVVGRIRVSREEKAPLFVEWVWDPHPTDAFLEKITALWIFFPLDPAVTRLEQLEEAAT